MVVGDLALDSHPLSLDFHPPSDSLPSREGGISSSPKSPLSRILASALVIARERKLPHTASVLSALIRKGSVPPELFSSSGLVKKLKERGLDEAAEALADGRVKLARHEVALLRIALVTGKNGHSAELESAIAQSFGDRSHTVGIGSATIVSPVAPVGGGSAVLQVLR